jgi:hypothetical protein
VRCACARRESFGCVAVDCGGVRSDNAVTVLAQSQFTPDLFFFFFFCIFAQFFFMFLPPQQRWQPSAVLDIMSHVRMDAQSIWFFFLLCHLSRPPQPNRQKKKKKKEKADKKQTRNRRRTLIFLFVF